MVIAYKSIQDVFKRFQPDITNILRRVVSKAIEASRYSGAELDSFYGQFQYQLGWVDTHFSPATYHAGKLLRPTLLLLAFEVAGAAEKYSGGDTRNRHCALPAAAAIELTHNFTLIHDDIEDGDEERRHRPTVWKIWGVPQAINTGSGMFSLARLVLWEMLETGVEVATLVRLGTVFDNACLTMMEGQYLDMSFEDRLDISIPMYLDMVGRKTATLMGCAAEMGALLGTYDQKMIDSLRRFGKALGVAFQVRDDILGVWASSEKLGRAPLRDIYRRKKSLPVLFTLNHAASLDRQRLHAIYQQKEPLTEEEIEQVFAIFARTQTQEYCHSFLTQQCKKAQAELAKISRCSPFLPNQALADLSTVVCFVEKSVFD